MSKIFSQADVKKNTCIKIAFLDILNRKRIVFKFEERS